MYYINFHTGAGDETADTLEQAMRIADDGACYTQQSISIEDNNGNVVAQRTWYGVEASCEELEDDEDIIEFGSFGHYGPWVLF